MSAGVVLLSLFYDPAKYPDPVNSIVFASLGGVT
jgi:hypothetical protein